MREGFEEYLLEFGPLGDNGKGTRRALREKVLGLRDRRLQKGYAAVVESALVRNAFDANAPNEDLVKCAAARDVCIDDFATADGEKKLNNATLRSLTGGNVVSGHGKNEKGYNIDTNFLVRLIFNAWPEWAKPWLSSDRRRAALIYYPRTFKTLADPTYDPNNPNHCVQVDYKAHIGEFALEFIEWCRILGPCTHAGGMKRLWPIPQSMFDWIDTLLPDTAATPAGIAAAFIERRLEPLTPGGVPSSRDAVIKELSVLFGGDGVSSRGRPYLDASVALRNELATPDKKWRRSLGGVQHNINVFKFGNADGDGQVCTLKSVIAPPGE